MSTGPNQLVYIDKVIFFMLVVLGIFFTKIPIKKTMNYNNVNILSLLLKIGIQFQKRGNCGRIENVGKMIK